MSKREAAWRRTLMTFLLIGTILAQMTAGVGMGEAMQVEAADQTAEMSAALEAAANKAIAAYIDPGMKPYEKVLSLHDYLILNCKYDYENLKAGTLPDSAHTAYGALVNGKAVCDGYTEAFLYLMNKIGVPCRIVRSKAMNHTWNVVQLDGKWYHVDVTYDDPLTNNRDCLGQVRHDHLLLSDRTISEPTANRRAHRSWVVDGGDVVADSDTYERAFWFNIETAICFYDGDWYYHTRDTEKEDKLVRRGGQLDGGLLDEDEEVVVDTVPIWNIYARIWVAKYGEYLYYTAEKEIRRLGKDGSIRVFSLKKALGENSIFGFIIQDGYFIYSIYRNPSEKNIFRVAIKDAVFTTGGSDQEEKPKKSSLKKGDSVIRGNVKFVVLNPGKKTVSVEGVASAKKKKFVVNIPSTVVINGSKCKVTEVKKKGFAKFAKVTKVSFGKNITKVGKSAFDGCKKLKTIAFKGTKVPTFKSGAFKGTASKVKVKFAKNMSEKNKTKMKKKLKKAGIKKIR